MPEHQNQVGVQIQMTWSNIKLPYDYTFQRHLRWLWRATKVQKLGPTLTKRNHWFCFLGLFVFKSPKEEKRHIKHWNLSNNDLSISIFSYPSGEREDKKVQVAEVDFSPYLSIITLSIVPHIIRVNKMIDSCYRNNTCFYGSELVGSETVIPTRNRETLRGEKLQICNYREKSSSKSLMSSMVE